MERTGVHVGTGKTPSVAEVAWDDDSVDRWVVWWYRYDETRRERRNTVVAAFTDGTESSEKMAELSAELERLKAEGKAEPVERISAVLHPAGYRAEVRARRAGLLKDQYRMVSRRSDQDE